jgi:glucosylceramidase
LRSTRSTVRIRADAPIAAAWSPIDSATGAITRNVEYYVLGHASRFVRPGAHRIESTTGVKGLESVAFQNADDGSLALIVLNSAAASANSP